MLNFLPSRSIAAFDSRRLDLPAQLAGHADERPAQDLGIELIRTGHDLGLDLEETGDEGLLVK
jgi:hypothetical protein